MPKNLKLKISPRHELRPSKNGRPNILTKKIRKPHGHGDTEEEEEEKGLQN